MKKDFFKRALIGAPVGVLISLIISIVISYAINDGTYYATVPGFNELCGGQVNAVAVQTAGVMLYGAIMAGASVIWENEKWSLTRQTVTHLIVCSLATLPAAYFMQWIEQSVAGVLSYYGMFLLVYLFIWLVSYFSMKRKVTELNKEMEKRQDIA